MKGHLLTLFLVIGIGSSAVSQDSIRSPKPKHHFLRANYHIGQVLQTNDVVKGQNTSGEPITNYHALAWEFGKQTDGTRLWERVYNFPNFGFGLYNLAFFTDSEDLGYPNALYGFVNAPFVRGKRGSFNWKLGFGLSYNWNPFDPEYNPLNSAIGSINNFYIDAGIGYSYSLSPRWDIDGGVSFTHFSNGASSVPNAGINLHATRLSLQYNFNPDATPIIYDKGEIPEYQDENELYFMFAIGSRECEGG